jgi:hypothetical protein
VMEGLDEGDVVVTGQLLSTAANNASRPTNPFSSGSPFGRGPGGGGSSGGRSGGGR